MPRLALTSLLLCAAACKAPAGVPDAGTPIDRGTDLRSAITTLFPEYRGAVLAAGRAQLTRTLSPATEKDLVVGNAAAAQNGFIGLPPTRKPFAMEHHFDGGTLVQELRLGLSPDELGRITAAPAALTSESMAHWFPKVAAPKTYEEFELELVWVAKDEARADFLVWQLVDGALNAGWKADLPTGWQRRRPDGGAGEVPRAFLVTVSNADLGARFEVERKAERARLRYVLTTFERR
ncbi:MAG: hypothetical protein IPJ65_38835 [Archangiaceae bacterium]|nr:hypothetical protein [Archangiaceae bacterium]